MGYLLNFFGEPCAGKTGSAANVFSYLKDMDCDVALVAEYAQREIWEGSPHKLKNQFYISAKQHKLIKEALDYGHKLVITDSPILTGLAYVPQGTIYKQELEALLKVLHSEFNNINILVRRAKAYSGKGRLQTQEECDVLREYFRSLVTFDYEVEGRRTSGEALAEKIYQQYKEEISL